MNIHIERIQHLPKGERIEKLKQLVRFSRRAQKAAFAKTGTAHAKHFRKKGNHFVRREYQFRQELERLGIYYTEAEQ